MELFVEKIIYLAGGLGNNLFQVSYGYYLESKGFDVVYNTSLLRNNVITKYLKWSVHENQILSSLLSGKKCTNEIGFYDFTYLIYTFIKKKITKDNLYRAPNYKRYNRFFGYFAIGEHLNDDVFFKLRQRILSIEEKSPEKLNDVTIHIRRGDFSENVILGYDYYRGALDLVKEKGNILLVTDDKKILKDVKVALGCEISLSNAKSMKEDFFHIFHSKVVVMSNSTFCYWASVLGEAEMLLFPDRINAKSDWIFVINKNSIKVDSSFLSEKL